MGKQPTILRGRVLREGHLVARVNTVGLMVNVAAFIKIVSKGKGHRGLGGSAWWLGCEACELPTATWLRLRPG